MFVIHFVSNKRREKTAIELMSIKKREKESSRVNSEAVTILSLQ